MEFVEGETLRNLLDRVGRLDVNEMLRMAHQMMDGLEEAHRCGVIHRDLKPENIMITAEGLVKLMGFPSAAAGDGAPEQSDVRIDIYSLGLVLYEIVCGAQCGDLPGQFRDVLDRCIQTKAANRFGSVAEMREALTCLTVHGPITPNIDPRIMGLSGSLRRKRFPITESELTIGRDESNDIHVDDRSRVSIA